MTDATEIVKTEVCLRHVVLTLGSGVVVRVDSHKDRLHVSLSGIGARMVTLTDRSDTDSDPKRNLDVEGAFNVFMPEQE